MYCLSNDNGMSMYIYAVHNPADPNIPLISFTWTLNAILLKM